MSDPFSFISESEPSEVILGSFVAWRTPFTYDNSLYSMQYVLRSGVNIITLTGEFVDGRWSFSIPGSVSTAWVVGTYAWDLNLVRLSDDEKIICASGMITLFRSGDDRRTPSEVMLAKIESILMNRADDDVESYTIGSRSITKMSIDELTKWRNYYRSEVARESSGGRTPTLKVRFVK